MALIDNKYLDCLFFKLLIKVDNFEDENEPTSGHQVNRFLTSNKLRNDILEQNLRP